MVGAAPGIHWDILEMSWRYPAPAHPTSLEGRLEQWDLNTNWGILKGCTEEPGLPALLERGITAVTRCHQAWESSEGKGMGKAQESERENGKSTRDRVTGAGTSTRSMLTEGSQEISAAPSAGCSYLHPKLQAEEKGAVGAHLCWKLRRKGLVGSNSPSSFWPSMAA